MTPDKRGFIDDRPLPHHGAGRLGDRRRHPRADAGAQGRGRGGGLHRDSSPGKAGHVNYDADPQRDLHRPEVASVGKTEEELKAAGVAYKVGKFPFTANARAKINHETEGFVKVLADAKTDRVLGVHMIGPGGRRADRRNCVAMEFARRVRGRRPHLPPPPHPLRGRAPGGDGRRGLDHAGLVPPPAPAGAGGGGPRSGGGGIRPSTIKQSAASIARSGAFALATWRRPPSPLHRHSAVPLPPSCRFRGRRGYFAARLSATSASSRHGAVAGDRPSGRRRAADRRAAPVGDEAAGAGQHRHRGLDVPALQPRLDHQVDACPARPWRRRRRRSPGGRAAPRRAAGARRPAPRR